MLGKSEAAKTMTAENQIEGNTLSKEDGMWVECVCWGGVEKKRRKFMQRHQAREWDSNRSDKEGNTRGCERTLWGLKACIFLKRNR